MKAGAEEGWDVLRNTDSWVPRSQCALELTSSALSEHGVYKVGLAMPWHRARRDSWGPAPPKSYWQLTVPYMTCRFPLYPGSYNCIDLRNCHYILFWIKV